MIVCPECQCPYTSVLDRRDAPQGIRRRRKCRQCETRFSTLEIPAHVVQQKGKGHNQLIPSK